MSPHHPFLRAHEASASAKGDRSVGQDLDNIFRLTAAQPAPHSQQGQQAQAAPQPAPQATVRPIAQAAVQPQIQGAPERVRVAGVEPRRVTAPDLDAALDMLNRAAKAMDLMQSRYQQVEDYAKGIADRAEKDVAVAYAQAREWEVRAATSDANLEETRQRAEAAERRAEAAEHRAEMAERRAEAAERNAKEARDWLECFYDKIVTSFDTRNFLKSQAA